MDVTRPLKRKKTRGKASPDPEHLLHTVGRASSALMYARLYCPRLIEVDGSVLLADGPWEDAAESLDEARQHGPKRLSEVEGSFNFVEVPYLFGTADGRDTSDDEDWQLAECIAEAWRAWLTYHYPARHFCVEVIPPEETGSVVAVSFCERR